MNKKRIYIILAVIIVLVLIIVFIKVKTETDSGQQQIQEEQEKVSKTKLDIPKDAVAPKLGEEGLSEEIAIPITVSKASPTKDSKFRRFEVKIENDKYSPSDIIVNQNDIVHIDFVAIDKDYDVTFPDYGMKRVISKNSDEGGKRFIEFQALNPGKFLYYCEICGGLDGKVKGYITVIPSQ